MLDNISQDLRLAARSLAKNPGFTLAATLILALGIGATSSIFSIAHGVLLRPLPYEQPDRLVRLWPETPINKRALLSVQSETSAFTGVAGFATWSLALTEGGEPEVVSIGRVSSGHFRILGAKALLGRTFADQDHQPGGSEVVLLSHSLWQRRFGGSSEVLGQSVEVNGRRHRVIGVMASDHRPLNDRWQLWTPLVIDPSHADDLDSSYYLGMVGRLASGVSAERAEDQLQAVAWSLVDRHSQSFTRDRAEQARVVSLHENIVGAVRPTLRLLVAAVAAILLVASANVANLLLGRAAGRRREMAIRSALGASRRRLVRQLMVESTTLAAFGGLAGILTAMWAFDALLALLPTNLPRASEIAFDQPVLMFSLGVTILSAWLFGIAPALRLAGANVRSSLVGGLEGTGRSKRRLTSGLVIFQVAASTALLVTALLLLESLTSLRAVDPGFKGENVLSMQPALSPARYGGEQVLAYYDQAFERLMALPGTQEVGAIQLLPMSEQNWHFPFSYEGQPETAAAPKGTSLPMANFRVVTPGYFEAMAVPILEGRSVERADREEAAAVGWINRTLAEQLWPGEEALGKSLFLFGDRERAFTVAGVVGDVRHHGLTESVRPAIYWPLAQSGEFGVRAMTILLRSEHKPEQLVADAKAVLSSLDPSVPITGVATLPEILEAQVAEPRLTAQLTTSFALLALVLGMIGVYGVISCAVAERTSEISLRMALGAARERVMGEILGAGLRLIAIGLMLGLAAAAAVGQIVRHSLHSAEPPSLLASFVASLALFLSALLALWLPARRASRIDPAISLRHD